MVRSMIAAVSFSTLASTAFAADLPIIGRTAVAAVTSTSPWSGFYVGGYAGGVFGRTNVFQPAFAANYPVDISGATAGALLGFMQQSGPMVFGLESEFGFQGRRGSGSFSSAGSGRPINEAIRDNWVGRIRGQLGYAIGDVLLFVAGGVSLSSSSVKMTDLLAPGIYSMSKTLTGWNIGAGVDYQLTRNWIGRAEYIYDLYPSSTYAFSSLPLNGGAAFSDRQIRNANNTIRLGVVYKFDSVVSAVVAKY